MKKPKIPDNENKRIQELHQYDILDTPSEALFDEITKLAACICRCEISFISLVDSERQWFKSRFGLDVAQTPREISFCGHAILGNDIFEVPDTSVHPDFFDNPLCVHEPNIRFYAGIPLTTNNGFRIGTLCVIDRKPNKLDDAQYKSLSLLAKYVMRLLDDKKNQVRINNLQHLLENSEITLHACSWQYNIKTKEFLYSKQFSVLFDMEFLEDNLFNIFSKRLHPDDYLQMHYLLERALYQGKGFAFDHRLVLENTTTHKMIQTIVSIQKNNKEEPLILLGSSRDLSKQIEHEKKLRTILSSMNEGLIVHDKEGNIEEINPAAKRLLGISNLDADTKKHWNCFEQALFYNTLGIKMSRLDFPARVAVETGKEQIDVTINRQDKNGDILHLEFSSVPLSIDGLYKPNLVITTIKDLTGSSKVQNELSLVLNSVPSAVFRMDNHQRCTYVNHGWIEITGWDPIESTRKWFDAVHPNDLLFVEKEWRTSQQEKRDFDLDFRILHKNGTTIYVQAQIKTIHDVFGVQIGFIGSLQDITRLKSSETQNLFYKKSLDETTLVSITDEQGVIQYINQKFCDTCGYSESEIIGKSFKLFHSGITEKHIFSEMKERIRSGLVWSGLICNQHKSGSHFWVDTIIIPQKDVISNELKHMIFQRDITSEVLAQNDLKTKTQEIDSFFSMALDLLCVAGIDGRFKRINPSFCEVLGYTEEELLSQEFIAFIHPDDIEKTLHEVEKLSKGIPTIRFENRYRKKDGTYCILSWTSSPNPETGLLYAAARDVTQERRQAQIKQIISETRSIYITLKNNTRELFDFILNKIIEITHAEYGFVGEIKIDPDTNLRFLKTFSLTNIAWNDETKQFYDEHAAKGLEFKNLDTLFGYVITTGEILIANEPRNHHASAGVPKGHPPLNSFLGIPIYHGGNNIGMVGLANRPRGFSEELVAEIQPLIDVLSEVIFAYQTEREIIIQKEQIKYALEKAQAATQAKSDFLSTMSHEIRTPLNAIIVMSELLVESQLDADQKEISRTIMNSGRLLLGIINDILDFSKIEAGKLDIDITEFNFNVFLREIIRPHQFTAEQKNLNFIIKNSEIPFNICSDSQKIGQVINNLLSNAIKFTDNGSISINSRYHLNEDTRYWLNISVQDTGIGIEKHKHDFVFTPFTQAEQSTNRNFGGTGLGLSISKHLIEFLGGTIRLESTFGVGTIFYIDIPISKGTNIQKTFKQSAVLKFPPLNAKILVAEDNITNQLVLGRILKSFGIEFICVQNGEDVLQKLNEDFFDLILMDCQMPSVDGYQATRLIRRGSNQSQIPIIALTAHAARGEEEKCIEAGMNGYVTKPIDRTILYEHIMRFLNKEKIKPLIDQSKYTQFEEIDQDEDFDIISETIQSFLTHSPTQIAAIQMGLESQNWKQIADAVHSLHSTARLLGAIELANKCYFVEHTIRTNSDISIIPTEVGMILNLYTRSCAELKEIYSQRNS